ncbi:prepilin-type N-terminal cleavage/methylation domain-containing protein [Mobilisporobacter senegalensis]|uniref:Prepilin-type N-terminal cleavage/methylation domain-containing protein n=2 Tax=Mobilisporobacter senegalensis TaxID=1329262 RepID=A0A3N1XZH0_9FIRM|nr:prepilin-type N-terminal cleavage/methylation domain-containing protein [Mobilisporobacter senegalensis]
MDRNNKGYTLIELIITLAILTIITTGAVAMASRITFADTTKAAKIVDSTMDKLRLETMTKSTKQYLHLYTYDNSIYIKVSDKSDPSLAGLDSDSGKKIGGRMSVYYIGASGTEELLGTDNSIVIGFERSSGAFSSDYDTIRFEYGGKSSTIYCIKATGRHYVS